MKKPMIGVAMNMTPNTRCAYMSVLSPKISYMKRNVSAYSGSAVRKSMKNANAFSQ